MPRRSGGRRARKAERAAPLAEAVKPVRPGQTGGQFQPLSAAGVEAIVDNAFRILDRVGFADATPHCIETCTAVGAVLGDDGRLRMPRSLVERTLQQARRNLVLHGQDPRWDLDFSGARVHFSTAGAAVMVADSENGVYRDSEARDLYDMDAHRRHLRAHSPVSADLRPAGHSRQLCTGHQYPLLLGDGHQQARRFQLGGISARREEPADAAHDRRRRGRVAGAPLRQSVQLLCGSAVEVRHRCPRMLAGSGAGRHARIAVVGRPGRCDRACLSGRDGLSSLGGVPRRVGLCERDQARRTGNSRHLAVRFGPAYRGDERRLSGAGPAVRRLRPGRQPFRPALRHRLRHERRQVSGLSSGRGTCCNGAVSRLVRGEHRL